MTNGSGRPGGQGRPGELNNDADLERRLGWILRGGVIASSTLLIAGLALSLLTLVVGDLAPASGWTTVAQSAAPALIRAGLVVLLSTPIARVAASVVSYLVSRDWLFVLLTSIVLAELAAAIVAAIAG